MLPHVLGETCWCRPEVDYRDDGRLILHRVLALTVDSQPRATLFLADGIPV